jgi:serine/threonine protein kinase
LFFRELPPHPNVVQMFGVSLDGTQPIIVMEYCSGGHIFLSLSFSLISNNNPSLRTMKK